MKKKIYAAAVMLLALAAPFVVTACDDDDEDEEGSSSSSSAGNAVDLGLSVYPKNVIRVQTVYGKPKSSMVSQIPLNAFLMFSDLAK